MVRPLCALALLLAVCQGCTVSAPVHPPVTAGPGAPPSTAPAAAAPEPSAAPVSEPAAPAVAAAPAADADAEHHEEGDEEGDEDSESEGHAAVRAAPKLDLTDEQLADKVRTQLGELGSISVGTPGRGYLINGVQMAPDPRWELISPGQAWATSEALDGLTRAIDHVHRRFANTTPLSIGHWSAKHGGWLSPHKSHQAGRDVDVGYYYSSPTRWFARATAANLDLPRTWAFVKYLATETDVDMIFIDSQVQRLLVQHAAAAGEDAALLDRIFQVRGHNPAPIVRHIQGHATHIHVRFFSPTAQEIGRRAQRWLHRPAAALASAPVPASHGHGKGGGAHDAAATLPANMVMHRARNGDILVNLARQYGTTPEAIAQANNLKGNALKSGQTYRIPVPAKNPPAHAPAGRSNGHHGATASRSQR